MKDIDKECFICGSKCYDYGDNYVFCKNCEHQIINNNEVQCFIINDILNEKKILRKNILIKFMEKVVLSCSSTRNFLLDIGSGSGAGLFHLRKYFKEIAGIEITEECIKFAREKLNLKIYNSIEEINSSNISVATFWHSLEHIPTDELKKILVFLKKNTDNFSILIISVPNVASFQYHLFGKDYAYYDFPNHIHQFSYNSLILLMKHFDFYEDKNIYSFYYIFFGYLQGFLNKFNRIHNYFYYRRKRNFNFGLNNWQLRLLDYYNLILIIFFIFPAFVLTLLEYIFDKKRGVITICFKKKKE